jgi:hypothetical protein
VSDPEAPDLKALAAEVAALRAAVAELAVAQAEGLNAMVGLVQRFARDMGGGSFHFAGQSRPPSFKELQDGVLGAAERSLAVAADLVTPHGG